MILILTERHDGHTEVVVDLLKRKGAEYVRFETADFPQDVRIRCGFNDLVDSCTSEEQIILLGNKSIDLSNVRAVWYRRPKPPEVSAAISPEDQRFARDESSHFLRSLWYLLSDRFWVNPYGAGQVAEHKPYQLKVAREVGFDIPRTLMTNDPDEVMGFFERCKNGMIYKSFTPYIRARKDDGAELGVFTNCVSRRDLSVRRTQVALAPCIFQEYVPKSVELRVTVVGRQIFAAEIQSQKSERSKHDWRRYDFENTPYAAHELPQSVVDKIHKLMKRMGLVFGCLDFVLTPDGRYVFLEINPNGQWYWIEQLTGFLIADAFAEMLIEAQQLRSTIRSVDKAFACSPQPGFLD